MSKTVGGRRYTFWHPAPLRADILAVNAAAATPAKAPGGLGQRGSERKGNFFSKKYARKVIEWRGSCNRRWGKGGSQRDAATTPGTTIPEARRKALTRVRNGAETGVK